MQHIWTRENEQTFQDATVCHIRKTAFGTSREDYKVRDHCHTTGEPMGAAHNKCNLERRAKTDLIVYIHNFSGYDSHFLVKNFKESCRRGVSGIATNSQKFKVLTLNQVKFVDSLAILNASLSELTNDLVTQKYDFPILANSGIYKNLVQRSLLLGKGIYPYEYMNSFARYREKKLP